MRYERDIEFEGPCPCGAGDIEVILATPNGAYGRPIWESSLNCAKCGTEYDLADDKAPPIKAWLIRKDDATRTRIPVRSRGRNK